MSSGCDNNDLIDNLIESQYIRTTIVENAFRAVDRAKYLLPQYRDQAYKDLAWKKGNLHLSAPCIYSEVMEGLDLKDGLSFLNLGSGTGYLSTMVGLTLGINGINHGIEIHANIITYAEERLEEFLYHASAMDEFEFCQPKFFKGNCLCLPPTMRLYDRVYCGAACPREYENYFKQLIRVGGILVMPLDDNLLQIRRISDTEWSTKSLLNVSFATLIVPSKDESTQYLTPLESAPPNLQILTRSIIRRRLRKAMFETDPDLIKPPARPRKKTRNNCPRRIDLPLDNDSDTEALNVLHDLDPATGSNEMNALLSLVLSMGQNRVAGSLNFDIGSNDESESDTESGIDGQSERSADTEDNGGGDASQKKNNNKSVNKEDAKSEETKTTKTTQQKKSEVVKSEETKPGETETIVGDAKVEGPATDAAAGSSKVDDNTNAPSTSHTEQAVADESDVKNNNSGVSDTQKEEDKKGKRVVNKREKFDSGLGEDNSPEFGHSSPSSDSSGDSDDMEDGDEMETQIIITSRDLFGHRRLTRYGKRQRSKTEPGDESSESGSSESKVQRLSPLPPDPSDVRRQRISNLMRKRVNGLPLPVPLKKFINMDRVL